MGSSKSTQKTTSQSTKDPWGPSQTLLKNSANTLDDWMKSPQATSVYQGDRTIDPSPQTNRAVEFINNRGGTEAASGYLQQLIDSPGRNPAIDPLLDMIQRRVTAQTNANFSNRGTTGGTMHQSSLAQGLSDGLAQPLFSAYENDQQRRMQAASMLPGIEGQRYSQLAQAGQLSESYDRERLAADRQRFEEERLAPIRGATEVLPYATQIGQLGGSQAGTSKTVSTEKKSVGEQIAGGAMMGLSLMNPVSSVFSNGMMTAGRGLMGGGQAGGAGQMYAPGLSWAPDQGMHPWGYSYR